MTIDQSNVVDAIGVDKETGDLVLTIVDHLEWTSNFDEHLQLLQEKLDTYLCFIESGEIYQTYPDAKNRPVLIDVVYMYPLNRQALNIFNMVIWIIEGAGMRLRHRIFNPRNAQW